MQVKGQLPLFRIFQPYNPAGILIISARRAQNEQVKFPDLAKARSGTGGRYTNNKQQTMISYTAIIIEFKVDGVRSELLHSSRKRSSFSSTIQHTTQITQSYA